MKLTDILLISAVSMTANAEIFPPDMGVDGSVECLGNKISYEIEGISGEYFLPDSVVLYSAQSWIDLNGDNIKDCMVMDTIKTKYVLLFDGETLGEPRIIN